MKFSIIVPIYKVEPYLDSCIQSIISQSFKDYELILVDDGSTDNCPQICDKYASVDTRIKVIHKKNGGIVSARQAGVEAASGEYIACVDGDDWIETNYFESFSDAIEKTNADIVCCGFIQDAPNHTEMHNIKYRLGFYNKEQIQTEIYPTLIHGVRCEYFPPSLWAKVFRRELYKNQQLLIDVKVNMGEDGACVVPCIYNCSSLVLLHDCLYHYRANPSSMTSGHKVLNWDWPRLIRHHLEKQVGVEDSEIVAQMNRKEVHDLFNVVVSIFYQNKPRRVIFQEIQTQLNSPDFNRIIKEVSYKGMKANLMKVSLKYKCFSLIELFSKNK